MTQLANMQMQTLPRPILLLNLAIGSPFHLLCTYCVVEARRTTMDCKNSFILKDSADVGSHRALLTMTHSELV
eukprot:SAG31_NODE_3781_length_3885_cov_3.963286_4_plen_73_part_00